MCFKKYVNSLIQDAEKAQGFGRIFAQNWGFLRLKRNTNFAENQDV